jgi:hypothetical protein
MVADQRLGHFHVPEASLPQIQDWNYLIKTLLSLQFIELHTKETIY